MIGKWERESWVQEPKEFPQDSRTSQPHSGWNPDMWLSVCLCDTIFPDDCKAREEETSALEHVDKLT